MIYEVTIKETLSKTIEVEAKSKCNALDIVKDMYTHEEVILDYSDYIRTDYYVKERLSEGD